MAHCGASPKPRKIITNTVYDLIKAKPDADIAAELTKADEEYAKLSSERHSVLRLGDLCNHAIRNTKYLMRMAPSAPAPAHRLSLARTLPFWLLLPGLLVIAAIQIYPSLYTFYLGFQRIEPGTGRYVFAGWKTSRGCSPRRQFIESVGHTVIFLLGTAF